MSLKVNTINHASEYEAIKILMHQWADNYINVQLLYNGLDYQ